MAVSAAGLNPRRRAERRRRRRAPVRLRLLHQAVVCARNLGGADLIPRLRLKQVGGQQVSGVAVVCRVPASRDSHDLAADLALRAASTQGSNSTQVRPSARAALAPAARCAAACNRIRRERALRRRYFRRQPQGSGPPRKRRARLTQSARARSAGAGPHMEGGSRPRVSRSQDPTVAAASELKESCVILGRRQGPLQGLRRPGARHDPRPQRDSPELADGEAPLGGRRPARKRRETSRKAFSAGFAAYARLGRERVALAGRA